MDLMTVESFDISHCAKGSFFGLPQPEVINLIFIGADPLAYFTVLIEPENQDTDHRDIEDHSVGLR
jgi:hypothetical protein